MSTVQEVDHTLSICYEEIKQNVVKLNKLSEFELSVRQKYLFTLPKDAFIRINIKNWEERDKIAKCSRNLTNIVKKPDQVL